MASMSGSEFDLEELSGIGRERANDLRSKGLDAFESIARASVDELTADEEVIVTHG